MMNAWRPLALAAALTVTLCAATSSAQTVVVRSAPPGSTVELVLNTATVGQATVNPAGDATIAADLAAASGKPEVFAHIYVDTCDTLRRVLLVDRALQPPSPASGCTRQEITGAFLMRRISTLVVNVGGQNPTVLLRQGPVDLRPPRVWDPSPAGFVLFGGGGLGKVRDTVLLACGNVPDCSGDDSRPSYAAGVSFWMTDLLAVEVGYLRPSEVTAAGSTDAYRFDSLLDAHIATVDGRIGVPVGRVRIYGQAGGNYHRAKFSTTQTIDDATRPIDGEPVTIPGGTQTLELRTSGWGWQYGGGIELWLAPAFGIYSQFGRVSVKGAARDIPEGALDDALTYVVGGVRVRIGG